MQCHTKGKELANDKCLGCHDHANQKAKIAAGRGFHASSKVAGRDCWTCHLEHKGKGHDVMGWAVFGKMQNYDHELSEFKLNGAHKVAKCENCHTRKNSKGVRLFLGEKDVCGTCHKEDQPHRFEREEMMKCDRCHGEIAWKPSKKQLSFDHNDKKQAEFGLEGSHLDVACAKCHPKSEFNLIKDTKQCSACHENVHQGQLFETVACDKCHSPTLRSLATYKFNHDKETKFDLDGKHDSISCYDCHPKGTKKLPKQECEQCHAKDNKHGDRFKQFGEPPPSAARATRRPSWKSDAVQPRREDEVHLTGKHAAGRCRAATAARAPPTSSASTRRPRAAWAATSTRRCHDRDSEYKDSQCLQCHKPGGELEAPESTKIVDVSTAPGRSSRSSRRHKAVPCATATPAAQERQTRSRASPRECGKRCHEDSLHKGALGKKCSRCHASRHVGRQGSITRERSPTARELPAQGRAQEQQVRGLPPASAKFKDTPTQLLGAAGCHADDDAHKGRLGNKCEKCHVETGDNIFNHNTMSAFQPRREAPRGAVRGLPSVGDVQAAARRLLRLPPRAGRPQGPVRHRLRAVPHHADVGGHQAAARRRRLLAARRARQHRVRALPQGQPPARRQRQPVHQLPPPGRHPQQLAVAEAAASATRSGRSRRRASITRRVGCNLTGPAPHARVLRLPQSGNFAGSARSAPAATATTRGVGNSPPTSIPATAARSPPAVAATTPTSGSPPTRPPRENSVCR